MTSSRSWNCASPELPQILIGKVAVAIDGDIIHDPFLDPIRTDSEVYFLHRIEGG